MTGLNFGEPATGPIKPGDYPEYDVILASRVSLDRNLEGLAFPHAMGDELRAESSRELATIARAVAYDTARSADLDQAFKAALAETGLYSRAYLIADEARVAFHRSEPTWMAFCDDNHLSIRTRREGLDLARALTSAFEAEEAFSELLGDRTWAFDGDAGFILADADGCGTGLRASAEMHLPALVMTGLAESAFKRAMEAGFSIGGRFSRSEASQGAFFEISLPPGIREAEESAVDRLRQAALALAEYERRARESLLRDERWEVLDTVGRALGRAACARLVSADEAMDIVSGIRLGLSCGILEGMDLAEASEMRRVARIVRPGRKGAAHADSEPDYPRRARALRADSARLRFTERYADV